MQRRRKSVSGTKRKADDPKPDKEKTALFAIRPEEEDSLHGLADPRNVGSGLGCPWASQLQRALVVINIARAE
jgi:hypothetical protein